MLKSVLKPCSTEWQEPDFVKVMYSYKANDGGLDGAKGEKVRDKRERERERECERKMRNGAGRSAV